VQLAEEATKVSVVLSPSELVLETGDTVVLSATVTDGSGNVISDVPVTWSSSDKATATVDSRGLVTARARGTAAIRAAARGRSGHTQLQVTQSSTPAPSAGGGDGGAAWPGEPSGFTMITDQPWNELPSHPANPWSWNPTHNGAIVDATAPTPGGKAFRATVRKGTDGRGSHNTWYSFPSEHQGYSELYFSAWYNFPKEWQNHISVTKQLWPAYDGAFNQLLTAFGGRSMSLQVRLQGQVWGNRNLHTNLGPSSHRDLSHWRDQWVRLEYYVRMNAVNDRGGDRRRADGVVRMWMTAGGQRYQIMSHEDVKFLSVGSDGKHWSDTWQRRSTGKFTGIKWNPTYGGIGDPAPRDMSNFMAHVYVSGR
jgi:hypothetical protein